MIMEKIVEFINSILPQIKQYSAKIVLFIAIMIASVLLSSIAQKVVIAGSKKNKNFDNTLEDVIREAVKYLVISIGLIVGLDVLGVNTTSIIALLGAAGIAVGLALKDTLSNIAAGVMLILLRPFKKGHFIEFSSFKGKVVEINFFTTILKTGDGLYISAPNSALWGNTLINYTRNGTRRVAIIVGISYDDSIDTGLEVLRKVADQEEQFLTDPAVEVMVESMGESSINLQLRGWVHVDEYWNVFWRTNRAVKLAIEEAGLTIPYPQRDLHIIHGENSPVKSLDC